MTTDGELRTADCELRTAQHAGKSKRPPSGAGDPRPQGPRSKVPNPNATASPYGAGNYPIPPTPSSNSSNGQPRPLQRGDGGPANQSTTGEPVESITHTHPPTHHIPTRMHTHNSFHSFIHHAGRQTDRRHSNHSPILPYIIHPSFIYQNLKSTAHPSNLLIYVAPPLLLNAAAAQVSTVKPTAVPAPTWRTATRMDGCIHSSLVPCRIPHSGTAPSSIYCTMQQLTCVLICNHLTRCLILPQSLNPDRPPALPSFSAPGPRCVPPLRCLLCAPASA